MQDEGLLVVRGSIFDRVAWKSESLHHRDFQAARSNVDTLWDKVNAQMQELGTPLQRNDFLMSLVKGFVGQDSCEEDWQQEHYNTYLIAACSKLVVAYADNVSEIDENEAARQVMSYGTKVVPVCSLLYSGHFQWTYRFRRGTVHRGRR
jgi:hypothetical protein